MVVMMMTVRAATSPVLLEVLAPNGSLALFGKQAIMTEAAVFAIVASVAMLIGAVDADVAHCIVREAIINLEDELIDDKVFASRLRVVARVPARVLTFQGRNEHFE